MCRMPDEKSHPVMVGSVANEEKRWLFDEVTSLFDSHSDTEPNI